MIYNLGRLDARSYQNHDDEDKSQTETSIDLDHLTWLSACEDFSEYMLRYSFKKQLL
jgi:hypothetical protein